MKLARVVSEVLGDLELRRRIVERHGGTITARSKEDEGSTFVIRLPSKQRSS